MKKNMKSFSYSLFKNVALLSSLGICVSCSSNNTVNKHNQDKVKGGSSKDDDEENNTHKTGPKKEIKGKEGSISVHNEKKIEYGFVAEKLNKLKKFESKRVKSLFRERSLEINHLENLYIFPTNNLVFEIMPNNEVRLVCLDKEEDFEVEKIDIPDEVLIDEKLYLVTSIGNSAFNGYKNVKHVNLPSSVNKIGELAFFNCEKLILEELPKNLTEIGRSTFWNCKSLKLRSLPEGLTKINDSTFENCENLELKELPSSITEIGNLAFCNCKKIELKLLPKELTKIGYCTFADCENIELTGLPSNLTKIGNLAFFGCKKIQFEKLPNRLTKIGNEAFKNTGIEKITIPKSVKELGNAAFDTNSIIQIILEEGTELRDHDVNRAYGSQLERIYRGIGYDPEWFKKSITYVS